MKIIVQKFGGTSVRDEHGRAQAFRHIKGALNEGYKVVVVVSAMGRQGDPYATDTLLQLIGGANTHVTKRERDIVMSCGEIISSVVFTNMLGENGIAAVSMTGAQAGFRTTADYTNAKIVEMKCERLLRQLEEVDVVVVAGFQGAAKNGDMTTIGRGGSDTSAAALGAAINADYVDIFTDVEGVMTADPRIVENARQLDVVTYNEICNMAYQGAKVIHPRAVEIAMQAKIPLRVRSTYSDSLGTLVTSMAQGTKGADIKDRTVTGIAHVSGITQLRVQGNEPAAVFQAMANAKISVDFISISPERATFTVTADNESLALETLHELGYSVEVTPNCAKVSAVGAGIAGVPGVTAKIVTALAERNIAILQSADSHTTIWVLVREHDMKAAVNALHDVFLLAEEGVEQK